MRLASSSSAKSDRVIVMLIKNHSQTTLVGNKKYAKTPRRTLHPTYKNDKRQVGLRLKSTYAAFVDHGVLELLNFSVGEHLVVYFHHQRKLAKDLCLEK